MSGVALAALALELMNDRDREKNDCGCIGKCAGMDGEAMRGGRVCMWYVMQVVSGQESRTVLLVEKMVSGGVLDSCFVPMRRLRKKFRGEWHEVTERLFPGYVFLVTEEPQLLYEGLKGIPALTRMLGRCGEYFTALSGEDVRFLRKLQGTQDVFQDVGDGQGINGDRDKRQKMQKGTGLREVGLSQVVIGENRKLRIVSGPLQNLEGQIRKMDLHKRIAVVETEFMGNRSLIHLGIEIVDGERKSCMRE